jgi:hypothetical protein
LLHYLSTKLSAYYLEGSLVHLPADLVLALLSSPFTNLDSEDHLFDFIFHWYTGTQASGSPHLTTLDLGLFLDRIKWQLLSE